MSAAASGAWPAVRHLIGGYETTGLHEVALSGFQLGQFGHHCSSVFLAVTLTRAAVTQPVEASGFLLDTILSAYTHGREALPLPGVPREDLWHRPVSEIRASLGVVPYGTSYPPGLLEELRPA